MNVVNVMNIMDIMNIMTVVDKKHHIMIRSEYNENNEYNEDSEYSEVYIMNTWIYVRIYGG